MQKKWWQEAIVYQIYVKSFCDSNGDGIGDLKGITSKLDYLKDLGVNCLWLNPIYQSPQEDNGYDVSDFQAIEPSYGTLDDFKELLSEAHSRGIRIILDFVLNHSSDEHRWFKESRKSKDNPYRNYYYWRAPKNGKEPNNWGNYFYEGKGSAWEFDETTGEYYLHHYSVKMPDLNWGCKELREEMYNIMRWWLDMGIDGFRLDAVNRLKKPDGLPDTKKPPTPPVSIYGYVVDRTMCVNIPGIHDIIREINREVWSKYDIMCIGEATNTNSSVAFDYICEDNHELDMIFHFEMTKKNAVITVKDYKRIQNVWAEHTKHNAWISQFLSNHDTPRQVSWFGNDREYRVQSAKLLATLTHTMPGTPFVYQGEEIGMANVYFDSVEDYNEKYLKGKYYTMIEAGVSPEEALGKLRDTSRDNARTPFQWDDTENAGFTTGKPWIKVNPRYTEINVEKDKASDDSVFRYYQKLLGMRKTHPAIIDGELEILDFEHEKMVIYTRTCAREKLLIVANWSNDRIEIKLPEGIEGHKWNRVLTNYEKNTPSIERKGEWEPWECEVYMLAQ